MRRNTSLWSMVHSWARGSAPLGLYWGSDTHSRRRLERSGPWGVLEVRSPILASDLLGGIVG